jgi:alanine-synthesizing transaminase
VPRFSHRTPASFAPNALTRALEARRQAGLPILDATESNPTRAGFTAPPDMLDALRDPRSLRYDPTPQGLLEAREAVAARYGGHPDRIFLTASSSESYSWLFKLLCDPGDEILVPRPSYPLFECLAELDAVRVAHYRLSADDSWRIDFHSLEAAVSARTRALVFVNPNNPTGSYIKADEIPPLVEFCARHDLALIADEVFLDYSLTGHPAPSFSAVEEVLTFTLSGLSKPAGLPQMKLGWLSVSGADAGAALRRLEWIADSYLPVSAPIQYASVQWIESIPRFQEPILRRVRAGLQLLRSAIPADSSCRLLEPEAGWAAILEVPRIRTEEVWALRLLSDYGVLLQPGYFYDFDREAYLVAGLLSPPPVLETAMKSVIQLSGSD